MPSKTYLSYSLASTSFIPKVRTRTGAGNNGGFSGNGERHVIFSIRRSHGCQEDVVVGRSPSLFGIVEKRRILSSTD